MLYEVCELRTCSLRLFLLLLVVVVRSRTRLLNGVRGERRDHGDDDQAHDKSVARVVDCVAHSGETAETGGRSVGFRDTRREAAECLGVPECEGTAFGSGRQ